MHAHASEYLLPYLQAGSKVLDVGSGSGYLTAILHYLVSPGNGQPVGKVVGIDHISELVDWSVENLKKDGLGPALENGQIEMIMGDGRKGMLSQILAVIKILSYFHLQVMSLLVLTIAFTLVRLPRRSRKS